MSLRTDNKGGVSLQLAMKEISSEYFPTHHDGTLLCDATGGAFTVYLKAGFARGQAFFAQKVDSSAYAVTIKDHAGNTLAVLSTQYATAFVSRREDATWAVLSRHIEAIVLDVGDQTTDLTAAAGKKFFRMPYAFTLTGVRASVSTAPVGSTIIVDINEGAGAGTSILSTKLTIDAAEFSSTTAAAAAVISDTALDDDAQISIDIDQIGSGTAGKGLKVVLLGYRA